MNKPDSLRAAVTAILPELARDPDKLRIWIDSGRIRAAMIESRSFSYEYKLTLELIDFAGAPALVFLAINEWLRINQPDLAQTDGTSGYTFEAEPIDQTTIDLIVTLELTERAVVTQRPGGGWQIEHPAEPDLQQLGDDFLTDPPAPLGEVWVGDVQIAP
jgi:hypothetical protein